MHVALRRRIGGSRPANGVRNEIRGNHHWIVVFFVQTKIRLLYFNRQVPKDSPYALRISAGILADLREVAQSVFAEYTGARSSERSLARNGRMANP